MCEGIFSFIDFWNPLYFLVQNGVSWGNLGNETFSWESLKEKKDSARRGGLKDVWKGTFYMNED